MKEPRKRKFVEDPDEERQISKQGTSAETKKRRERIPSLTSATVKERVCEMERGKFKTKENT